MDRDPRAVVVDESARAGAAVAGEQFRTALGVERKSGKTDVVGRADRIAQEAVDDCIREYDPDAAVVGEGSDGRG